MRRGGCELPWVDGSVSAFVMHAQSPASFRAIENAMAGAFKWINGCVSNKPAANYLGLYGY
jgi:hypothetical protein